MQNTDWPVLIESHEDFVEHFVEGGVARLDEISRHPGKEHDIGAYNASGATHRMHIGAWSGDRQVEGTAPLAFFASPEVAREVCDDMRSRVENQVAMNPGLDKELSYKGVDSMMPEDSVDWAVMRNSADQSSRIAATLNVAGIGRDADVLPSILYRQAEIMQHDRSVGLERDVISKETRMQRLARIARNLEHGGKEASYRESQAKDASERVLPGDLRKLARDVPTLFPNDKVHETAIEVAAMGKGRSSEALAERIAGLPDKDYGKAMFELSAVALDRAGREVGTTKEDRIAAQAFRRAMMNNKQVEPDAMVKIAGKTPEGSLAGALCTTVTTALEKRAERVSLRDHSKGVEMSMD